MNKPSDRVPLSVGLNTDYAGIKELDNAKFWLSVQKDLVPQAKEAFMHILQLEGLMAVEKGATLYSIAGELRKRLKSTREKNLNEYNKGFLAAISMIENKYEGLDLDSQAATSIAEIQAATLLSAAEQMTNQEDYDATLMLAKAIDDGCCQ